MGVISEYTAGKAATSPQGGARRFGKDSRSAWREVFRGTDKESPSRPRPQQSVMAGTSNATAQLLRAMRTNAPGGWSEDRWEQIRHYFGITYVAVFNICRQISRAEYQVFKRDESLPDGKRPVRKGEEGYELVKLLQRPNKHDSFGRLMFRWTQQKYLTGMALTWMVPNMLGRPMELYCIPTPLAIPQPAANPEYPEGFYRIQPVYPYGPFSSYPTPTSAVGAPIPAQWVMKFQYPHPLLRYEGYSHLTGMRAHIDALEMIDRSRHSSMRRGINPSAVLNFKDMESGQPLPESEIERIKADFENESMGPENFGKLFVSTVGAELEPWGISPADMAYKDGWDQLTSFIMGGFGITKPAAGMVEDSSYATLFATLKQLHLITLEPECEDISADLTMHLAPFFGEDLIVEVRCKRIDDHELKMQKIDKLCQYGAITYNQLLNELDMPMTHEDWGGERVGKDQPDQANGMGGMPGAGGGEQGPAKGQSPVDALMAGAVGQEEEGPAGAQEAEHPEPPEVTRSRPRPGPLGQGALGPRKALNGKVKSFFLGRMGG